jgi:hypothetical protein
MGWKSYFWLNKKHTLNDKGKFQPSKDYKGPDGKERYSCTLSLTSALDGGGWSRPSPGRFIPRKDPGPIAKEAGWDPGPVWTGAENLASPPGFDPRNVQPVASRYRQLSRPTRDILYKQDVMTFMWTDLMEVFWEIPCLNDGITKLY